ncbi:DMP12 family DNA mimic protein, partial [Neisseria gonorrhoeae]|uniref:DMP12 family DNA mimic protein n=1 Tax=Neisseria gonorrhoeae TaxID=485 RepID=UPI003556686D
MNEHNLLIFCLKDNVSISEYTEMVDWAYENIQSETVVEITENQIIEYQNRGYYEMFDGEVEADESYFGGQR